MVMLDPAQKELNKKLFSGDWIHDDSGRLAFKLDKKGVLIFDCQKDVSKEEKTEFTIVALVLLGVDEDKAVEVAEHMGPIQ